jgi:hypothetical protein
MKRSRVEGTNKELSRVLINACVNDLDERLCGVSSLRYEELTWKTLHLDLHEFFGRSGGRPAGLPTHLSLNSRRPLLDPVASHHVSLAQVPCVARP